MDPTAPKDNPPKSPQAAPPAGAAPPNPWSTPTEPTATPTQSSGPIETGQYVAVGGQDPVAPAPTPAESVVPPMPTPPLPEPPAPTLPPLPENPPMGNGPILGATPPPPPEPALPDLNLQQPAPPFSGQPNPTPYAPPPSGPQSQMPTSGGFSKIKQLRVVIIIAGVLVLVVIIAALLWFFVLAPKSSQPANIQGAGQTEVIEPSPLPKVTRGGFGDLPSSTASSQATKSAAPSGR